MDTFQKQLHLPVTRIDDSERMLSQLKVQYLVAIRTLITRSVCSRYMLFFDTWTVSSRTFWHKDDAIGSQAVHFDRNVIHNTDKFDFRTKPSGTNAVTAPNAKIFALFGSTHLVHDMICSCMTVVPHRCNKKKESSSAGVDNGLATKPKLSSSPKPFSKQRTLHGCNPRHYRTVSTTALHHDSAQPCCRVRKTLKRSARL